MAQIDPVADALVGEWLSLPEVAVRLNIPTSRVKQLLRDRKLLAVVRPGGERFVPAAFLDGGQIVKGLCGTLTVLFDCGRGSSPLAVHGRRDAARDTDPGALQAPGHRGQQARPGAGFLASGLARIRRVLPRCHTHEASAR